MYELIQLKKAFGTRIIDEKEVSTHDKISEIDAEIVPDNLKSAVLKSSRFEPTLNETFADLGEYYGTTILPARAYKPRGKSLVEGAVKILYRRIYAHLKETPFYTILKPIKAAPSSSRHLLKEGIEPG